MRVVNIQITMLTDKSSLCHLSPIAISNTLSVRTAAAGYNIPATSAVSNIR